MVVRLELPGVASDQVRVNVDAPSVRVERVLGEVGDITGSNPDRDRSEVYELQPAFVTPRARPHDIA